MYPADRLAAPTLFQRRLTSVVTGVAITTVTMTTNVVHVIVARTITATNFLFTRLGPTAFIILSPLLTADYRDQL